MATLFNGNSLRNVVVGAVLLLVGAVGGMFLRVENIDTRVQTIESNRFTDRDATALEVRIRQERVEDLKDIKDDIARILTILEARR